MKKKQLFTVICLSILFSIGIWTFSIQSAQLVTGNDNARKSFQIPYSGYECKVEFSSESDERWFKINVEETSSIKPIHKEGDTALYELYSANQLNESNPVPIYSSDFGGDSWNKQLPYKVEKGEYYIRLTPRHGSTKRLTWSIEVLVEDLYEPNDNYLSSKVISPGIINFNLYGTNDIDRFKVEVTQPGTIKINVVEGKNIQFELYSEEILINSQASPLIIENELGNFSYAMSRSYSVQPGIYYLNFKPNGDWVKSNAIEIDYSFIPDDDFEPNNAYTQSKVINEGIYNINLIGENDIDWFKLVINQPSSLIMDYIEGATGALVEFYQEDEIEKINPQSLHRQDWFGFSYSKQITYKFDPGVYYIKLSYDNGNLRNGNLKISFKIDTDDIYEINDVWTQASTIKSGIHNIKLIGINDVDWLKINMPGNSVLKVSVEKNNGIKYELFNKETLLNSNNQSIASDDYFGEFGYSEISRKLDSGDYYLKFSPSTAKNYENIPILIEILENDSFEPNDIWEQATHLDIGKSNAITINAPNDIDWFKFSLPTKTTLRLIMNSSISKNFKYEIYNEDNSNKVINSGVLNSNGGNQAVVLNAGEYKIKLSGDDRNYSKEQLSFLMAVDGVDMTRPKINSVSPTGNNNDIDKNIEITFSKPMDLSTMIKENFSIKYFNDEIDFNLDYIESENKVILIPNEQLNYNGQYEVTIFKNVKARNNKLEMASNYEYQFKTREKRPNDSKVGTVIGKVELPKNLQMIASVGTIEVFRDNDRIRTITPDRYGKFTLNDLEVGNYSIRAKIPGFLNDSKSVVVGYGDDLTVTLYPIIGDLNGDGIIDLYDITIVSQGYNEESR